jgi:hypothetical protein
MAKAKQAPDGEAVATAVTETKTKAQAIRDALAVDPNAMPKELADKLTAEGWNVTSKNVSQAKFLMGRTKKKPGKKAVSKPAKAAAAAPVAASVADAPADLISVAALQKAKKLIQELGGVKEAKQALAALGQLLD